MKEGIAVKARGRESIWALQNFRYLVSFKKCLRRACLFQVWCQGPGRAQSLVLPLQESVLGSRAAVCVCTHGCSDIPWLFVTVIQ
jgi:hypothetical protein